MKTNIRVFLVFSLMLAVLVLSASGLDAQNSGNRGLFGLGPDADDGEYVSRGVMNRGGDSESFMGYNLYNQQFGDNQYGGYNLYNQTFGQEVPLGSGCLILAIAGAGYALSKRKNNGKNKKS